MGTLEITKDNFEATIDENDIVLLDFWAEWCGPCKRFGPIFEDAAGRHPDLVFGKIDTEAQQELAGAFGIMSIPTLMVFRENVIVFSQFVEMLELIEAGLVEQGISFVKLTGQTKDRETPVKRFQDGEVPVFLISLKAGGTGLTLTRADTVIHYDPWWNPAVENQATDRAHRIGQDKTVFVYKLIAEGTVEEKMVELQGKKQALVDSVLSGTAAGLSFTEADIEALFAPLPELDA